MRSTNLQLIQEVNILKQNMAVFTMPTKIDDSKRYYSNPINFKNTNIGEGALNSVRSAIENTYNSLKSK